MFISKANMNFGQAIEALKEGKKVARKGWNGKGMFLFLVKGEKLDEVVFGKNFPRTETGERCVDSICMKTAQKTMVVGWLASQTDMLAEDWEIVD